jgi:hypothetical protein
LVVKLHVPEQSVEPRIGPERLERRVDFDPDHRRVLLLRSRIQPPERLIVVSQGYVVRAMGRARPNRSRTRPPVL